ncbi:MAG: DNA primase [Candidatus Sericytochromatia bacterium]|nr:DNA primase [Candidatus Sericytochromatia bacterium]
MSLIPDDPIAEVRARADIVEVVSDTVVLKRSGRNYTGLCPFHNERSPSFNVNPERQIFRCFGCGEGGDVFTFVMKAQHQTFPEALRTLADRYGVPLPERQPDSDERARIREANESAADYFIWLLEHEELGAEARQYLRGRGVDDALRKRFRLGLSPRGWDGLHRHLLGRGVPVEVQEAAALARPRASGQGHYDYFRNRVMFPITNEAGHVVGFGARALASDDEPKYLNSPETLVYRKGNLLYGLNEARTAIKTKDRALLMEGYMDVITAHAHGFEEAVGVLGTALTPNQARALLRYTPSRRVVLAFDADRAGQQAAERGIATLSEVTQGVGLDLRVLAVPSGKDPDAYLRAEGAAAFEARLSEAPVLFEFLLERTVLAHDTTRPEGRSAAVAAAVPVLRRIASYVTQDHYVSWLASRLAVRPEAIRLELGRGQRPPTAPTQGPTPRQAKKLSTHEAERILLYLAVERPAWRETIRERTQDIPFSAPHEPIRQALVRLVAEGGALGWPRLLEACQGDAELLQALSALSFTDGAAWGDQEDQVVEDCLLRLEMAYWQGHKQDLMDQIKRDGDPTGEATQRLQAIIQHLRGLDHRWRKMAASGSPG